MKKVGYPQESTVDAKLLMNCSTRHGFFRTMERANLNDQQAYRLIRNAWERGKSADQLPLTTQREYVARRISQVLDGYTAMRVYGKFLFIFSAGGRLITMHPLPKSFGKKQHYEGKERVRDVKKYTRFMDAWKGDAAQELA